MTKLRAEIIRLRKDPAYTRVFHLLQALMFSTVMEIAAPLMYHSHVSCAIAAFVNGLISFLLVYTFLNSLGKPERGDGSGAAPDRERGSSPEAPKSGE